MPAKAARKKERKVEQTLLPADHDIRPDDWGREVVKLSTERTAHGCYRRTADLSLMKILTPEQRDALDGIAAGEAISARGIGFKLQSFERTDKGDNNLSPRELAAYRNYIAWQQFCDRRKIDYQLCLLVVSGGYSLTELARELTAPGRALRTCQTLASAIVKNGLTAYCDMMRWPLPDYGYIDLGKQEVALFLDMRGLGKGRK